MLTLKRTYTILLVLVLLLVLALIVVSMAYWQHITGVNALHVLASAVNPLGPVAQGC